MFGRDTANTVGFPAQFELSSLAAGDGSSGFVLKGIAEFDATGYSVSPAGDVNGDGTDDLMVGAPVATVGAGKSYVVFGRDTTQAGNFPAEIDLSSLALGDGIEGFVLAGIDEMDQSGFSVSAAGDIDGDGIGDMFIGAPSADPAGRMSAGESYVVFGRNTVQTGPFPPQFDLSSLATGDASEGFTLNGVDTSEVSGNSVSTAGDLNGDGVGDLLIGAMNGRPGGRIRAGKSYVVYGLDTGRGTSFPAQFELSSLAAGDGSAGFVLNGGDASSMLGIAVSAAGDMNGDGIEDVVVGEGFTSNAGQRTYVVFGRADTDADGLHDATDNCVLVANADQRDTNSDGFGNACDADLDNNCTVDFLDLAVMKSVFFTSEADADLSGDASVGFSDLAILKQSMFQSPGPSGMPNDCEGR